MADDARSIGAQFQAFVQRWWSLVAHPLATLREPFEARLRPEAHRQQMMLDTEGPVRVLPVERSAARMDMAAPGQTAPLSSQDTPLKYTAAEELAMLRRTLDRMRQDNGPLPGVSQTLSSRSLGYDGPDDVRLPREMGPASGSLEAALIDVRLEANRAREDETPRSLREQTQSLHERLDASLQSLQTPQPTQQRDQGRGW
jgi:hypothetical protein